jgi:hypothetical protein
VLLIVCSFVVETISSSTFTEFYTVSLLVLVLYKNEELNYYIDSLLSGMTCFAADPRLVSFGVRCMCVVSCADSGHSVYQQELLLLL